MKQLEKQGDAESVPCFFSGRLFHGLERFGHRDCADALSHEKIDHVGKQVGDQDGKDIADRSDPCQEDHIVDNDPAHHSAVEEHAERKTDETGNERENQILPENVAVGFLWVKTEDFDGCNLTAALSQIDRSQVIDDD